MVMVGVVNNGGVDGDFGDGGCGGDCGGGGGEEWWWWWWRVTWF